jgi:hypothetical protein
MIPNHLKKTFSFIGYLGFILLAVQGIYTILKGEAAWAATNQPSPQAPPMSSAPPYLNYAGYLEDGNGQPLTGSHTMTIRIYDNVGDATAFYCETQQGVNVNNGNFSMSLGGKPNECGASALAPRLFDDANDYVGITVDSNPEATPRERFTSVVFAFNAENALNAARALDANRLEGTPASQFAAFNSLFTNPDHKVTGLLLSPNGDVGVGTTSPEQKLHVLGNRIRLQSGNKVLDLRTDGNAVDLFTSTNDLFIRSARDGNVHINTYNITGNPEENDGHILLGAPGNNVNVQGDFEAGGEKPVVFRRYEFQNDVSSVFHNTGLLTSEYECGIAGFNTNEADVNEKGRENPFLAVYTYAQVDIGGKETWHIRANLRHDGPPEKWTVTLICVDTQMASWVGPRRLEK